MIKDDDDDDDAAQRHAMIINGGDDDKDDDDDDCESDGDDDNDNNMNKYIIGISIYLFRIMNSLHQLCAMFFLPLTITYPDNSWQIDEDHSM
jgi:hypothetical protein